MCISMVAILVVLTYKEVFGNVRSIGENDLRGSFLGDFQLMRKSLDGVKPTGGKLLPFMILRELVLVLLIGDFLW